MSNVCNVLFVRNASDASIVSNVSYVCMVINCE